MATLEQRLSLLHGPVDEFERHVEDLLSLNHIPYLTAIWMKIQQLREEMKIVALAPLTIPMPTITMSVLDLFSYKPAAPTSRQRLHTRDNDLEATHRHAQRLE